MIKSLIYVVLVLFSLATHAQTVFNSGEIVYVDSRAINFDDRFFVLSPTVKVWSINKDKVSLSVLKPGNYVSMTMIKIGKKTLVDHIYITTKNSRR